MGLVGGLLLFFIIVAIAVLIIDLSLINISIFGDIETEGTDYRIFYDGVPCMEKNITVPCDISNITAGQTLIYQHSFENRNSNDWKMIVNMSAMEQIFTDPSHPFYGFEFSVRKNGDTVEKLLLPKNSMVSVNYIYHLHPLFLDVEEALPFECHLHLSELKNMTGRVGFGGRLTTDFSTMYLVNNNGIYHVDGTAIPYPQAVPEQWTIQQQGPNIYFDYQCTGIQGTSITIDGGENQEYIFILNDYIVNETTLEGIFRFSPTADISSMYLIFGYQDNDNHYRAYLRTNSTIGVQQIKGGTVKSIWAAPYEIASDMNYKLKITINEFNEIEFYVNDELQKTIVLT